MATAMEVEEKLKDITDCPICLETYKEPKILPCIHTFCTHCLRKTGEKLNKNPGDTMPCPVCRKDFTVPDTGFEGLQKNFFMDKLTEITNILQPSSAQNLCDACREDNESFVEADIPSAEMYCIQCHQKLCCECYKHHRKNKVTKNHKFIASGGQHNFESEDVQETLKTDSCEKHPNSLLEIYCCGCREVVCAICFVEGHQAHVGSDINKVATDFRKEIQMNVHEFSSFLPKIRQEEQELANYRIDLMRCTEDIQTKVSKRRQELKELVDKDADLILSELETIRQQNLKKCEFNKENIETLLVCLESYKAYCLKLTAVGSASDIILCRAKSALDIRTRELKQYHAATDRSSYQLSHVSFKVADLQDCLRFPNQNIAGTLEAGQYDPSSDPTEDGSFKRSSDAKFNNLQDENLDTEKLITSSSQQDAKKSTPAKKEEEDEEESKVASECMELNLDSIELDCLEELELMLKSKLKEMSTDESSLPNKLKEVKQKMTNMLETIKTLNGDLEKERAHLRKVEQERNTLTDRTKDHESLSCMVEDLKRQLVLLNDLVHGDKKQGRKGNITCDAGVKFSSTVESISSPNCNTYVIFGIAILENELYVLGNDSIVIINDLSTMRFRRRWKMPSEGDVDDLKECNTNKCLYIMKVSSTGKNEILRCDPYGKVVAKWLVEKARGQLSVTQESNVLLTVSKQNRLQEYTPDGRLVQVVQLSWDSGIENPLHAIKLTSEHFLIAHDNKDAFCRVCIVGKAGDVLKYFGEPWKRDQLNYPIYLAIDGDGNILVVDYSNRRVLLLNSNLEHKLDLIIRTNWRPRKICLDESNGRVLIVENVWKPIGLHGANVHVSDALSIFTINNQ